jgi:hypothetical protein
MAETCDECIVTTVVTAIEDIWDQWDEIDDESRAEAERLLGMMIMFNLLRPDPELLEMAEIIHQDNH